MNQWWIGIIKIQLFSQVTLTHAGLAAVVLVMAMEMEMVIMEIVRTVEVTSQQTQMDMMILANVQEKFGRVIKAKQMDYVMSYKKNSMKE